MKIVVPQIHILTSTASSDKTFPDGRWSASNSFTGFPASIAIKYLHSIKTQVCF